MRFEDQFFLSENANINKLKSYGFTEEKDGFYVFKKEIMGGRFSLTVVWNEKESVTSSVTDNSFGDEYTLYKTSGPKGEFARRVKDAVEAVLEEISYKCFENEHYREKQTLEIISYVRETYKSDIEYLWPDSPTSSIVRRKDNQKWFLLLMAVEEDKIRKNGSKDVREVMNLRMEKGEKDSLVDNRNFYPGWHMNKSTWYSVFLDGSVSTSDLKERIRVSYELAKKK